MRSRSVWLEQRDRQKSRNGLRISLKTQMKSRKGNACLWTGFGQHSLKKEWVERCRTTGISRRASRPSAFRRTTQTCVKLYKNSWQRNKLTLNSYSLSVRMSKSTTNWGWWISRRSRRLRSFRLQTKTGVRSPRSPRKTSRRRLIVTKISCAHLWTQ